MTDLILRAVRGENLFGRPRHPDNLLTVPGNVQILIDDVLEPEREFELLLERWLAQRKKNE